MSFTDPVADFLTRLRNSIRARHQKLDVPASKLKTEIARILKEEGYIANYKATEEDGRNVLRVYAKRFVRDDQMQHPLAAPIHADLRGLPPLLVQAGGAETLLDDARRITARARDAGVDVTLEIENDMIHVWHMFAPFEARGQQAIERAGAFMKARTILS